MKTRKDERHFPLVYLFTGDSHHSFDIVIKHKNGPIIAHAIIRAELTSGRLDSGALSAEIEHGNIHVFDNVLNDYLKYTDSFS
jgi:hypothetical protein